MSTALVKSSPQTPALVKSSPQTPALVEYGGPEAELFRDAVGTDIATDIALAQETFVEATERHRALEKERKHITKPLLDDKRKIDALFAPSTAIYEAIIEICEETVKADRAAKREAQDRALAEAKTKEEIQTISAPLARIDGVQSRKVLKIRIVNEALIPDPFWILDTHSLKQEHAAGREVPGIEFYYDETLVVKG